MPVLSHSEQVEAREQLEGYRVFALEPAGIAPPGIRFEAQRVEGHGVWAIARPLRPEDQSWNQWTGGPRLFNNRMAHLFEVELHGEATLGWVPEGTVLELNDASNRLPSSASPEGLLAELLSYAKLQEDWILDGDLVARTRAAGPFRAAYMPAQGDGELFGLIGFPLTNQEDAAELAEKHIVAERLTVSVVTSTGIQDLVWVFD